MQQQNITDLHKCAKYILVWLGRGSALFICSIRHNHAIYSFSLANIKFCTHCVILFCVQLAQCKWFFGSCSWGWQICPKSTSQSQKTVAVASAPAFWIVRTLIWAASHYSIGKPLCRHIWTPPSTNTTLLAFQPPACRDNTKCWR